MKDAKKTVTVNVVCINRRGDRVSGFKGRHMLNLNADGKAVTAAFPLLNKRTSKEQVFRTYIKEPRKGKVALATDHIRVNIYDKSLGLSYEELLYPMDPKGVLQGYGVRLIGKFGVRKAALALHFNGPRIGVAQAVSFQMHLLDGEGNRLLSFDKEIALEDEKTTDFETDVTPPTGSTGPYKISLRLDNETLKMAMLKEARFPYATVLVPVSGMEGDILADWHVPNSVSVPGSMKGYLRPKKPLNPMKLSNILFSSYQPFARPAFDSKQRHSGTRSLRIDYTQASGPVVIGSNIRLPGLPVRARLWVKGNGTNDELAIVWRDPCNFNEASYRRWMNQAQKTVCRLNFTDWRSFEVPVMGDGLLPLDPTSYYVGHSGQNVRRPLNAPIFVAALRVIPERPAKGAKPDPAPRSVWIDDLMVETQVSRSERLSLELRTDTSERLLHEKAELLISVGNGSGHEIRKGRVNVKALDVSGKTVYDETEVIRVPKGEFATKAIPLAKLAALRPRGPVTVVVTVSGPVAGQRVQGRVVLAHPTGAGVFWDFERAEHFNAQGPGPGADPVAGGADKTGHALPLTASKKKPASVLLHPALPGYVTAVEMQVFGDGNPVTLQAVFADSGSRDFDIYYNQYSSTPIRVDWKGWKTCRFPAPPLPPNYLASQGNPLYSPIYPLNLILTARTESEAQVAVRVDQIKVITHLPPEEELLTQLEYPDDTMMHVEGLPLRLVLTNFSAAPRNLTINFRLITPTGGRAA
ncbi:MAG: hypothetical protein MJH11_15930, partial [Lentisphaeria bacterium]|nr:hypothetical protein [Lentisphaeria bacterium]